MFESLTEKITGVFDKLKGRGVISEENLNSAMREIRVALLESDVSISVAKDFIERVKKKALGKEVIRSVSPAQMIVKIVNDELTELLGSDNSELNLDSKQPALILMVGLQGSGKTTSTGKLAKWIFTNTNKNDLMDELSKIIRVIKKIDETFPQEILLVLDGNIGQNSIKQAEVFKKICNINSLIITKLDGTAKGGVLVPIAQKLAIPISYVGTGEQKEDLIVFEADTFSKALLDLN